MVGRPSKIDFNKLLLLINDYVNKHGFHPLKTYETQKYTYANSIWGELCILYFSNFSKNNANLIKKQFVRNYDTLKHQFGLKIAKTSDAPRKENNIKSFESEIVRENSLQNEIKGLFQMVFILNILRKIFPLKA